MGFDWSRLQGLGTLSEKATKDVADGFSDEDKRAIMDGAHHKSQVDQDPHTLGLTVRLLHTAIWTLAEAADENLAIEDGSRRHGRKR
jgi:hypothetical protein